MWVPAGKSNYVTKQILKGTTENIPSWVALGEPELTQNWAESSEDIQGDQARETMCDRVVRKAIFQEALTCRREGFGDQEDFSGEQQYTRGQQSFMTAKMPENYVSHLGTFVAWAKIILKPWPFFLAPQGPCTRSCRDSKHVHWRVTESENLRVTQKSAQLKRNKAGETLRGHKWTLYSHRIFFQ